MKKLRSYSSVWKVEQVIYSFGDAKLPTPVTVTQLLWLPTLFRQPLHFTGLYLHL